MVAEFITVWVLVTGAVVYRPSVELGSYTDKWSGTPTEFY